MKINGAAGAGQLKTLLPVKSEGSETGRSGQYAVSLEETRFNSFKLELFGKTKESFSAQSGLAHLLGNKNFDVSSLEYDGRSILDLSPEEAAGLVSEEGYYGVKNTAARLSGFVVNGGGDDLDRIRAGREGIVRGFREAEQLWGGELPGISYETLELALLQIDARIQELGGSVINTAV